MKGIYLIAASLVATASIACVSAKGDKPAPAPASPEASLVVAEAVPEVPVAAEPADCADDPNCVVEAWRSVSEEDLEEAPPAPTVVTEAPVSVAPVAPVAQAVPVAQVASVAQVAPAAEEPMKVVHEAVGSPAGTSAGALTFRDNAESRVRLLSQPTPPNAGTMGRYDVSKNRAADREASLAARAVLRAFEGAPPAMPHSANYSSRSKTCLDCHLDGMTIGKRVAHAVPHPVMANCQQCHVEQENKLYDELLTPSNSFEGQFFDRKGEVSIGGAPPMMPHGTFMRTKCLSCHGEFGYPGLRTPHPDRQNCLQCHITAMPK